MLLFKMEGTVMGARRRQGVRASLFSFAQQAKAFSVGEPADAITYATGDNSSTLLFTLWFKSESDALSFRNFLSDMIEYKRLMDVQELTVSREAQCIVLHAPDLRAILKTDYNPNSFDSPMRSLEGRPSECSFSESESFITGADLIWLVQYQSLQVFNGIFKPTKIHICDKARNKKYAQDNNNLLAGYANFHHLFDGRQTFATVPGKRILNVPLIKLVYKEMGVEPEAAYGGRTKIVLWVVFHDELTLERSGMIFKPGTRDIDNVTKEVCIYVENPIVTKECLEWKAAQYDEIWKVKLSTDVMEDLEEEFEGLMP